MKKIIICLIFILSIFMISGCNSIDNNEESEVENMSIMNIKITINDIVYTLNLENNKTTNELISMLPQEFNMKELNGNEKYVYMDNSLTTNSYYPKNIEKGDVMLYGDNCLVIFYKSFNTSYSYTKIGHIDNLPDLGDGNIIIKLEK